MRGLLDRKRDSGPTATVAVSKPFLNDGIAAQFITPHTFRHVPKIDGIVKIQVSRGGSPFVVERFIGRGRAGTPAPLRSPKERVLNQKIGFADIAAANLGGHRQ